MMRFKIEIPLISGGNLKKSQTLKCALSLLTREVEVRDVHRSDMTMAFTLRDSKDGNIHEYYESDDELYVPVGPLGLDGDTLRYIGQPLCTHPLFHGVNKLIKYRMGQDKGSAHSKNRFIPEAVGWKAAYKEPPAELSYRFPDHAELMASGDFNPWEGPYEEQAAAVEKRVERFVLVDGQLMQKVLEPLFIAQAFHHREMELKIFQRNEFEKLPSEAFSVDNDYHILSLRDLVGPNSRYRQIENDLQNRGMRTPEEIRFDVNLINPGRFSRSAEGANMLIAAKAVLEYSKKYTLSEARDVLSTVSVEQYAVLYRLNQAVTELGLQEDETLVSDDLEQALYDVLDMCENGHKDIGKGLQGKIKSALALWEERSVELQSSDVSHRISPTDMSTRRL